jgi:hypothetical protein
VEVRVLSAAPIMTLAIQAGKIFFPSEKHPSSRRFRKAGPASRGETSLLSVVGNFEAVKGIPAFCDSVIA